MCLYIYTYIKLTSICNSKFNIYKYSQTHTYIWCECRPPKQNNTAEISKRTLVPCPFWLNRVHAAYQQIRKANPLLLLWSNKDPWAEELPCFNTSLQAANKISKVLKGNFLAYFLSLPHIMYTLTHIRETIQSHKEIVPLEITLRTTESIRNVLTQLLHIAIGKNMSAAALATVEMVLCYVLAQISIWWRNFILFTTTMYCLILNK